MFRDVFKMQPCLTDRKLLSTVLASHIYVGAYNTYYVDCVIAWSPYNVIPVTPVVVTSSTSSRGISSKSNATER